MKNVLKHLFIATTVFMSFSTSTYAYDRISGANRYETAIEISKEGWNENADTVFLAKGTDFPDALVGTVLAYQDDAPILLTDSKTLHPETFKEIKRLNPSKIVILGGETAVSDTIINNLIDYNENLTIDRIGGKDRYETAALISKQVNSTSMNKGKTIIAIVNGENFPDAISFGPYAAQSGIPILLTQKDTLPKVTEDTLKSAFKEKFYFIGGTAAISDEVFRKATNGWLEYIGGQKIRISGLNRYETNIKVISYFEKTHNQSFLATGQQFPDALTGSVLAAKQSAPIILSSPNKIPDSTLHYLDKFYSFKIIGGESAISNQVVNMLP